MGTYTIRTEAGEQLTPLGLALVALSFFRTRHHRVAKYKNAKGRRRGETVAVYQTHAQLAREYAGRARAAGFSGSIREAVLAHNLNHRKES